MGHWYAHWKALLNELPHDVVFVDLFGGSGLLSHWCAAHRHGARVVWNDFDDYAGRYTDLMYYRLA